MNQTPLEIANEIFDLYQTYGQADYIGEPVSQIEHMSQAAQLAIKEGCDNEVVLAAFFHDIGHICKMYSKHQSMEGLGTVRHETIGADYIRSKGFPEKIAKLIENHVQAKRYLTFKHPEYYQSLSEASRITLKFQGGVMTANEALKFENDPLFEISIRMRIWDDRAKETDVPLPDMQVLKSKVLDVLTRNREKFTLSKPHQSRK